MYWFFFGEKKKGIWTKELTNPDSFITRLDLVTCSDGAECKALAQILELLLTYQADDIVNDQDTWE